MVRIAFLILIAAELLTVRPLGAGLLTWSMCSTPDGGASGPAGCLVGGVPFAQAESVISANVPAQAADWYSLTANFRATALGQMIGPFELKGASAYAYGNLDWTGAAAGPLRPGFLQLQILANIIKSPDALAVGLVQAGPVVSSFNAASCTNCDVTVPISLGGNFPIHLLLNTQSIVNLGTGIREDAMLSLTVRLRLLEQDGITPALLSVFDVPEPGALMLFAGGLMLLLSRRAIRCN